MWEEELAPAVVVLEEALVRVVASVLVLAKDLALAKGLVKGSVLEAQGCHNQRCSDRQ